MIRLIKAEAKKIFYYKSFMACAILYFIFMPLMFVGLGNSSIGKGKFSFKIIFDYPDFWHNITYLASWFNVLLCIMFILLVSNEFSYKTFRQNIIDGVSRFEVVLAKLSISVLLSIISTLYVLISGYIIGEIYAEPHAFKDVTEQIYFLGNYFIQSVSYMSLALLFALIFRRQGTSLIFFLIYVFVIGPLTSFKIPEPYGDYTPTSILSNLINNPLPAMFGTTLPHLDLTSTMVMTAIYTTIFLACSLLIVKKSDL
ncbi:MAG: ABC transporter permease subunit [Candidatus Sericytochromatia bacterium]